MSTVKLVSLLGFTLFWMTISFPSTVKANAIYCKFTMEQEWESGFLGKVTIPIYSQHDYGWVLLVKFNIPIKEFDVS